MTIRIEGKGGIYAEVLKDSIASTSGVRLFSVEIQVHRFVLAELNTHRMLAPADFDYLTKNAQSSRAVPVRTMIQQVIDNPAEPIYWGAAKAGMQAGCEIEAKELAIQYWREDALDAVRRAERLLALNLHKQVPNRRIECDTFTRLVITATEWQNPFWLRYHPAADPHIAELFRCIYECWEASTPETIYPGEWHVPYVDAKRWETDPRDELCYYDESGRQIDAATAKRISASACAQVSYRKLDRSLDKADRIYDMLIGSVPGHWTPLEHQCTPMTSEVWERRLGASRLISDDIAQFSGNIRGWTSHRKEFPHENLTEVFKPNA